MAVVEAVCAIIRPNTQLRPYLLVEVCDSSLRYDRVVKAHRYALAGIADYWIVNLIDRQLEIYRNPEPDPGSAGAISLR